MLCLAPAAARADVAVDAELCNRSLGPVEFRLYNHNDLFAGAVPLVTKSVRACTCVDKQTHTDLWHNPPPANIEQLAYRDVGAIKGSNISVCVSADGRFRGYVDTTVGACASQTTEVTFLPAPELTRAQGDVKVLETGLLPASTSCKSKDWTGGCNRYEMKYSYDDGSACTGNDG
jgi:hypothetical protein